MIWILQEKNFTENYLKNDIFVDGVAHLEEAEGLHDVLHCVILLHIVTTISLTLFQYQTNLSLLSSCHKKIAFGYLVTGTLTGIKKYEV
jgi:hypothetical protein